MLQSVFKDLVAERCSDQILMVVFLYTTIQ